MTSANEGRKSALTVAFVLSALAAWNFHRARPTLAWGSTGCAVALIVVGLFLPRGASAFHKGWMRLAAVLGYVNSRIILSAMYFLILAPFGLLLRLLRRDPLLRRGDPRSSYWIDRESTRQTKDGFERAF